MRFVFVIFRLLAGVLMCTPPALAQGNFGQFQGDVVARFLPDGRNMRLERPVTFIDPGGRRWDVPAGAETDGASIPRVLWISYPPFTGKYRPAAVVHDYYCRTKSRDWKQTHQAFYFGMRAVGVHEKTAKLMYAAVYQFGPRWGPNEARSTGPGQELSVEEQNRTFGELKAWIEKENPSLTDITRRLDTPIAPRLSGDKRVALVIGNSDYKHTPKLQNPRNDAVDVAAALKKVGFHVVAGFDLDKAAMDRKVREFAETMTGAAVGLFFYAGHGLQVDGQNYAVPVDAKLATKSGMNFELVRVDLVQRAMELETNTNILFLDACRDNPLARNLARALGTRSSLSIGPGLASIESGHGTLISFSTQPGNVALDGQGRNSPFSGALVKHIAGRGDDLSTILIKVRNDVIKLTEGRQVPWEHSALTERFYFTPPDRVGPSSQQLADVAYWNAVKDSRDPAVLATYLDRFPDGLFGALARVLIDKFRQEAEQRAALAAREDELTAAEVAKQVAEAKRADAARKAKEAKHTDELERARQQLRKAEDEARQAREAAKAADEQRLAAVRAAEEAAQASEKARRELAKDPARPEQRAPRATSRSGQTGGPDGVGGASFRYWANGAVPTGQSVTTVTADGRRLTCVGGSNRYHTPRRCRWN